MLLGAVALVILLVFAFFVGKLLSRVKSAKFAKAWAPLVPSVNGQEIGDDGGGSTGWLTGTYRGKPVRASMVPNRNRYTGESGHRFNYFDVALLEVPGKQNWRIEYQTAVLGFGQTGWRVLTQDAALEDRLQASGILFSLANFGGQAIRYQARLGELLYSEDVTPRWAPSPERFQDELELLLVLAKVNEEVNAA